MYLHLGNNVAIHIEDIIGIFDMDNTTISKHTRAFLKAAEDEGMVVPIGDDLPKSIVLCCPRGSWQRVYLSPLSPTSLAGRIGRDSLYQSEIYDRRATR